jgi:acetylornithine deacetylase/succinyl-diaminopimelate desuccinylase-like protein
MAVLADGRSARSGELVIALAGDEETLGNLGAQHVIDAVPDALGDAAIIGDAGSCRVLRLGEKGFLWIEIEAVGTPSHGAHVHLGVKTQRPVVNRRICAAPILRAAFDERSPEATTRLGILAINPLSDQPGWFDQLHRRQQLAGASAILSVSWMVRAPVSGGAVNVY